MGGVAIRVTGRDATLIMGGATTAAILGAWSIHRAGGVWHLTAELRRLGIPRFLIRARGLALTAPKPGAAWYWPIRTITIDGSTVRAELDPPEQ